jgi:hypothetical protein
MPRAQLNRISIIHLGRILNMLYRPSELAEELSISVETIYRSYIPAGMPHSKDDKGDIWINGKQFITWAHQTITQNKSRRQPLPNNMAWCLHCNKPVELINPIIVYQNRYLQLLQSTCPHCGTKINRGIGRQS